MPGWYGVQGAVNSSVQVLVVESGRSSPRGIRRLLVLWAR
jgi:hypothetical protein